MVIISTVTVIGGYVEDEEESRLKFEVKDDSRCMYPPITTHSPSLSRSTYYGLVI